MRCCYFPVIDEIKCFISLGIEISYENMKDLMVCWWLPYISKERSMFYDYKNADIDI